MSAQSLSESGRLAASWCHRVRQRSEAEDVDGGKLVYPYPEDVAVIMALHEPVGGPRAGETHRRFERFAQMREDLPDRAWFGDECDQPDIATAPKGTRVETLPPHGP